MSNDTIAGSGLEKMFYGQILSILVIIPLVGWIAAIVGIVLFLVVCDSIMDLICPLSLKIRKSELCHYLLWRSYTL